MQSQTHELTFTESEVRKRYVSWEDGEAEREWVCLTLLAEHAPGVAPRPLRRDAEGDAPVVVMERLPGEPLGDAPMTPQQTVALGGALRRVYDVPLDRIEAAGVGERRYGPTTHALTVADWLRDDVDLGACRDSALVAEAMAAAIDWLVPPDRLPEARLTALGIADLNPANVLWDGATCRLVDFEDGGLTDPAFELADHVEHIANRLHSVFDADTLVREVGLSGAERTRMQTYRPLWAAFWLAMLLPGNGGFRRNPPGTTEAQAIHVLALLADA